MGFDLYGLNPNFKNKKPSIDWDKKPTKEEQEKFFTNYNKWEKENPGHYFRNNVWWWRPLADFVLWLADEEFTEEERKRWHDNGGFKVSEKKANIIADLLEMAIEKGMANRMEEENKRTMAKARKHNKKIEEQHKELRKIVEEKTGKKELAPIEFPEPFKSQWDDIQKMTDYKAHYPFSVDNVKEFIIFCRASGGFEIC
jgi:hypothetical protein